ncbi:carbamoyl phosphate synthase small subunit [Nicoliella spurrieriana]|uniref:Carbamoyl phosphate synthase small chain n=1 Tax=Nicoliella spurrieriana TaxID=2925830 RepID=A0A976RRZ1_9LACO|nr:carbamoyl phosphate synthase small subunit [Nicoliella spurrieriana]UQS86665.1 carbamoyl phosphate synthase small subunit [Nicoliella spurrieriana]
MKRYLVLKNGSVYSGEGFGSNRDVFTEVVFSTGMTGYQETITDPSYYGQAMVFTYPLIGNYGINSDDFESFQPAVDAIIVHELARRPSNFRSVMSLAEYAEQEDLPGLTGVDTRKLAKEIRKEGSMPAVIVSELDQAKIDQMFERDYQAELEAKAKQVATKNIYQAPNDGVRIALLDFGLKESIVKALSKRNANVIVFPGNTPVKEIIESRPAGVLLSNGPGDPTEYPYALDTIRTLQERYPLMGICLGHQLFALANGAKTYKMKFGHRGFNHAVHDVNSPRCNFTSQNHGYAVDRDSLRDTDLVITHEEINDGTVEGVKLKGHRAFSVQFHPDACPGPHDSEYMFDQFIDLIKHNNGGQD